MEYEEKALEMYLAYVFMQGVKCKSLISNLKAHIDKLYKIHKNKEMYPKTLMEVIHLHHKSYRNKGKKNKKQKRHKGDADENNGSEEATSETNDANNDNNQTGENRPTVTAHMNQEDDKELNDISY